MGFLHGHDAGATLIIDGEIVVSISEERLNRKKKNIASYLKYPPVQSMQYCVSYAGITLEDVDLFVYNETDRSIDPIHFLSYTFGLDPEKFKYLSHHDAQTSNVLLSSVSCVYLILFFIFEYLPCFFPGLDRIYCSHLS